MKNKRPVNLRIVGKKTYARLAIVTSDVSYFNVDMFDARQCRRISKWLLKAAEYLDSKERIAKSAKEHG